jgi:rod shape determining protein RodA
MALSRRAGEAPTLSIFEKLTRVNWGLLLLLTMIAGIGFAMLYSAGNGNWDPWASRQMVRYGIGFTGLLIVALIDIRFWIRYAYFFYLGALILLGIVEGMGAIGMGARRWIDLGIIQLQPSEVMKIALILALARYFHAVPLDEIGRIRVVLFPLLLLVMPVVLVLRQPDLGTAIVMVLITGVVIFAAGIRIWKFALAGGVALAAIPIAWPMLHEYQRQRVLTFIDPSRDPLGAGYHITQSKIALGSGGTVGRGFMQGTQSHLSFLPERHTDFIFTMLAEEFGLVGSLGLLAIYAIIILYAIAIAVQSKNQFGRLLVIGVIATFSIYTTINVAMVTGLVPVVGVPLPFVSYGGTSLLTLMAGFGLVICVNVHRDTQIRRRSG